MKRYNGLIGAALIAAGTAGAVAPYSPVNEWNFYSDPAGISLSNAYNSAGAASFFGDVGSDDSNLRTDGIGSLISTHEDPGTNGMWTSGALMSAHLGTNITAGTRFIRYDFSYDLSNTNNLNDSGCIVGFAFMDNSTSNKLAGVALQYDVGASLTAPYQATKIADITNTVGSVAVIAKLDLAAATLAVWYDLNGDTSGFVSGSPMTVVSNLTLTAYNSLGFQATGDIRTSNSTDFVAIELLRSADTWGGILATAPDAPAAKYANEWNFERDVDGRTLSQTINSGTNSPLAQFAAGGTDCTVSNRALLCTGEDAGSDGVWTNGALLDAAMSFTTGVHYLRYDVDYDFSSPSNNSGSALGVYFTGETGDKAAGLVLGYDTGNLTNAAAAAGRMLTPITNDLPLTGTLIAIAEADLAAGSLKVWYSLDGSVPTNYAAPTYTNVLGMTSITNLRFHATGDFQPAGSTDYASVDNIRHTIDTTAGTTAWSEIIEAAADLSAPPALSFTVNDLLGGAMGLGETNTVSVVISNGAGAGAATLVTSTLTNDLSATAFLITSNNAPVALAAGESVTNTYELVAQERGNYTLYISVTSAETNITTQTLSLAAGANLTILPETITEPGGTYPGLYEPGETLNITITTTNDGARTVSNIVNTLSGPVGFTINPSSANYASLATGTSTSTTYSVAIGAGVSAGTYTFHVTNTAGSLTWTNSFDLNVFIRVPNTDWVKANNTNNLNLSSSWVGGAVPDSTDRAVLDPTVTSAITTDLGANLAWRGIALVSNTAAWTISGTNTLTTGSAGIDMAQAQANLTIASKLALATTQTWNVATSRTLTVSGLLSGTNTAPLVKTGAGTLVITNTANTLRGEITVSNGTLAVANDNVLGRSILNMNGGALGTTGSTLLTNSIVLNEATLFNNANTLTLNGVISGPGSLTKTNAGNLILNGANTWSGGTTNWGLIEIGHSSALGSGAVVMQSGSTLQASTAVFTFNNPAILNEIILDGNATLKTATATADDLARIDGVISGSGALTVEGYQLLLYGNNTFTGGLNLRHSNWLRVASPASLGNGPIDVNGGARLILFNGNGSTSNNIALGNTLRFNLNGKTVELAGQFSGTGAFDLQDSSGTLTLSGDNSGWSGNINNLRGTKTVHVNHPNALGTGTINYGGVAGRVIMAFNTAIPSLSNPMKLNRTFNSSTGESLPLEFNINQDVLFAGNLENGSSVNLAGVEKTGTAKLTLNGAATYSGPTKVVAGTLEVDGSLSSDLMVLATGTLSGNGTVGNVSMASGSTLQMAAGETLDFNGMLDALSGSQIVLPIVDTNSFGRLQGTSGYEAWLGGALVLDFSGATVQAGDVFQILSGWDFINDQGVTISKIGLPGTLELDTSNLFIDGTVSLAAASITPVPLLPGDIRKADNADNLNLGSSWVSGVVPGATNRAIYDPTILLPRTTDLGADAVWGGIALISNNVQWTISGNNKLTLRSGGIDLSQARADLNITSKLELGTAQTWNVGPLRTLTVSGVVSGTNTSGLVKAGEGVLLINGTTANTYAGATTVNQGTLAVTGTNTLGSGILTLDGAVLATAADSKLGNATALTNAASIYNNHLLTLDGIISGPGSLTKSGTGTLLLNGVNTWSGGTTNAGTIQVGNPAALGFGAVTMLDGSKIYAYPPAFTTTSTMNNPFVLNGAATFETIFGSAGLMSFDGNISGSGSLKLTGYQFYLRGNNTFSGGLFLDNSSWLWFENGALGTGPITTLRNTLIRAIESTEITNSITLNHAFRLNSVNNAVVLSGPMSGAGQFQLIDSTTGTIELKADNSGRSGTTLMRGGGLLLGHPGALGSGELQIQSQFANFSLGASTDLTGGNAVANDININGTFIDLTSGDLIPIIFNLNRDLELTGRFYSSVTDLPQIQKNGSGALILSGITDIANSMSVNAGSLGVNSTFLSEEITMASGTTLFGSGTVQKVSMASGSTLDLSGGGMAFNGDLTQGTVYTRFAVKDGASALYGNGVNTITMGGTLLLDFTGNAGAVTGAVFTVLNNWGSRIDGGLTIIGTGLPAYTKLDTSKLFSDGQVTIISDDRLSTQFLEITVPHGSTGSGSVEVKSSGASFTCKDDGSWPSLTYNVVTQQVGRTSFQFTQPPQTTVTNWNGNSSGEIPLGFEFPLYGQKYSSFSISRYGAVSFGGATISGNFGSIPYGTAPVVAPFWGNTVLATNSIRYMQVSNYMVIAWNNGSSTNKEFQTWIYNDGSIRHLYQYGITGNSAIGLQSGASSLEINHVPGTTAYDSLLITRKSWVTATPESANPGSGLPLTFTADATGVPTGDYNFTATIRWSDGRTSQVGVLIHVVGEITGLNITPSPLTFEGPAGAITSTDLVVSNLGSSAVNYTITDSGLQGAGYTVTNATYGWRHIPDAINYQVSSSKLGTEPLKIGFPFAFFGNVYTTLIVNANGTLTLGENATISPFGAALTLDANASVRYLAVPGFETFTVTWENMAQAGGSADQSFQVELSRDGGIRFNYKTMGSGWPNGTIALIDAFGQVPGSLINAQTTSITTNYTYTTNSTSIQGPGGSTIITGSEVIITGTNVVTNLTASANYQTLKFTPGARRIISASPVSGTIPAGGIITVLVTGDARSLDANGTNNVPFNTTLVFNYGETNTSPVDVTFTATNSAQSAYAAPEAIADMWGAETPYVDIQQSSGGSRTLSWPAAEDGLSRTYKVWFTTSLGSPWELLATVVNGTGYTDNANAALPVVFYKVTVE